MGELSGYKSPPGSYKDSVSRHISWSHAGSAPPASPGQARQLGEGTSIPPQGLGEMLSPAGAEGLEL